jgi:hypothetical protein
MDGRIRDAIIVLGFTVPIGAGELLPGMLEEFLIIWI